jgi:hypothetical protein
MSMIGLASPIVRLFQNPTGTIGALARAMLEFLYAGIPLAKPIAATPRIVALLSRADNAPFLEAARGTVPSLLSENMTTPAFESSE